MYWTKIHNLNYFEIQDRKFIKLSAKVKFVIMILYIDIINYNNLSIMVR